MEAGRWAVPQSTSGYRPCVERVTSIDPQPLTVVLRGWSLTRLLRFEELKFLEVNKFTQVITFAFDVGQRPNLTLNLVLVTGLVLKAELQRESKNPSSSGLQSVSQLLNTYYDKQRHRHHLKNRF